MNRHISGSIKMVLLILGNVAVPFTQTDWVSSVIPPGALFEALALNGDLPTKARPKYNSTTDLAVSPGKKMLFVAQQTAKRIDIVDIATETVTDAVLLPNEVTGIAVSPKGDLLYATCSSDRWPAGMVCIVDILSRRVVHTIAVGHGARAPVVTPDGSKLFVCNRFNNDLSIIDLTSRSEVKRLEMVREPYCAAITPDGKTVVVGNLLPDDLSIDTAVSGKVTLVNVETLEVEKEIRLLPRSMSLAGVAISPDSNYAFITHIIGGNRICTTCEKGWMNKNCLSIIDLRTHEYYNTVELDITMEGMANPWDIAFTENQRYLCITHAGCHELSVINYPVFIDSVEEYTRQGENLAQWEFNEEEKRKRDLSLLEGMRIKVKTTGRSPRTLAIIDSTIYTAGFFDDEYAAIQKCVITNNTFLTSQFPVGPKITQTVMRQGEANFYDATINFQSWQSCHSCHQFTRVDGLNRILGGSAVAAPKNTNSLVYSWWTPPTNWSGRRGSAQQAINAAIELELFKVPDNSITAPLDTFAKTLKPIPSPWLEKGKLTEASQRGKALFYGEKAQCFTCHSGPLFTDCNAHETAVPDTMDPNKQIYTPPLVEAWRTGPYGHLGSIGSVREMVELEGHNEAAAKLTAGEMDDLIAYVLSL